MHTAEEKEDLAAIVAESAKVIVDLQARLRESMLIVSDLQYRLKESELEVEKEKEANKELEEELLMFKNEDLLYEHPTQSNLDNTYPG